MKYTYMHSVFKPIYEHKIPIKAKCSNWIAIIFKLLI